jgi:hypothetical protein
MSSIEELIAREKDCIRRFRAKAAEIKKNDPKMTEQVAFCEAVRQLPKTADRYQMTRLLLAQFGVPCQPLR